MPLSFNFKNNMTYNYDAPWLRPSNITAPNFFNFTGGFYNNFQATGTGIPKEESLEEYKQRKAKEQKALNELIAQKQEINAALSETNAQIKTLEAAKKSDGSAEIVEDYKKMSTTSKILTGVGNIFSGIGNGLKSIIGYEKDGSWNPLKCLRNVAIAAVVGAACVFAGPIGAAVGAKVGSLLLAAGVSASTAATATTVVGTAIAATPTILRATGAVSGTILAGKGAIDTYNADTMEEFNNATQELGQGLMIAGASLAGGKIKTPTTSTAGSLPGGSAGSGFWGSLKSFFTKPFESAKATQANAKAIMEANGGGWQGFKAACKDARLAPARESKLQHEQQQNNLYTKFLNKFNELQNKYQNSNNPIEKIFIDLKGKGLYNQAQKLYNAKTKSDFKALKNASNEYIKELKGYLKTLKKDGEVEINGHKFTSTDKALLKTEIKAIIKEQKNILKDIDSVTKSRFDSMLKMSKQKAFETEVKDFGFSTNWYKQPLNWGQSIWGKGIKKMDLFNTSMTVLDPIWFLQPLTKNPAIMPLNAIACANPIHTPPMGEIITAEEYTKTMAELTAQKNNIEALNKQISTKIQQHYA